MTTEHLILTALAVLVLVAAVWYCASAKPAARPSLTAFVPTPPPAAPSAMALLEAYEAAGRAEMAAEMAKRIGTQKADGAIKGLATAFAGLDKVLPDPK